jgi:hypothetical protein
VNFEMDYLYRKELRALVTALASTP